MLKLTIFVHTFTYHVQCTMYICDLVLPSLTLYSVLFFIFYYNLLFYDQSHEQRKPKCVFSFTLFVVFVSFKNIPESSAKELSRKLYRYNCSLLFSVVSVFCGNLFTNIINKTRGCGRIFPLMAEESKDRRKGKNAQVEFKSQANKMYWRKVDAMSHSHPPPAPSSPSSLPISLPLQPPPCPPPPSPHPSSNP